MTMRARRMSVRMSAETGATDLVDLATLEVAASLRFVALNGAHDRA